MKFPFSDLIPQPSQEKEAERKEQLERAGLQIRLPERLVMYGTAFIYLVLPCIAVLLGLSLLTLWLFGAL